MCEICSKVTIKISKRRQWHLLCLYYQLWTSFTNCCGASNVDFEQVNAGRQRLILEQNLHINPSQPSAVFHIIWFAVQMTGFDMKYITGMRRFDLCWYLFYFFLKEDPWQHEMDTQPAFTCSKSRIETPEQCVTNFTHCSGVSIFDFGQSKCRVGWVPMNMKCEYLFEKQPNEALANIRVYSAMKKIWKSICRYMKN